MENCIKETQGDLFADRTSAATMGGEPAQALVRLDGLRAHVHAAPHRFICSALSCASPL